MATYLIKKTSTGTYVNTVEWDGDIAIWSPPAGHTAELATEKSLDQYNTDTAAAIAARAAQRAVDVKSIAADALSSSKSDTLLLVRAIVLLLIDELNVLRQWDASFKAATAAATSLANLQARVAALPATPDRTKQQALDTILAKIASGNAD